MDCLRLFRRLRRRSSKPEDDSLLTSQQRHGPRPYRDHDHKHKHSPSADSSFSTDFEKVSSSDSTLYRGSSRTGHGSVAVPVIRPNVNPAYSAYATPEVYRYGGAGPKDDGRTPGRNMEVDMDSAEEKERRRKAEEEEQERLEFLQMM
ncbi:hypothetical protein B0H65DRAFT_283337 [Neurospora tetraspora]|uniref:Uncharacterized protein n=1 Tax=Neurospora tetraspora TaxID=94610 RepID=A0AAE0J8C3_9PEZI|nr:hypothetical protein B0H65DRAFT_283337 [Neurospora tetraspora]